MPHFYCSTRGLAYYYFVNVPLLTVFASFIPQLRLMDNTDNVSLTTSLSPSIVPVIVAE